MDRTNIDYILDIFKILSKEVPEQMLYREDGDSIELRTIEDIGSCMSIDAQNNGWKLVGSRIAGAA